MKTNLIFQKFTNVLPLAIVFSLIKNYVTEDPQFEFHTNFRN